MFPKLKKGWIIGIVAIIILSMLNPTYTDFKEFTGLSGTRSKFLHKKANFLVCSIYENSLSDKSYLGVLKNFINVTPKREVIKSNSQNYIITDTASLYSTLIDTSDFLDTEKIKHTPSTTLGEPNVRELLKQKDTFSLQIDVRSLIEMPEKRKLKN